MTLSPTQIERYSRHIILPNVGGVGQQRLLNAIVHCDLSTSKSATLVAIVYLASAGVGTLILSGDVHHPVTHHDIETSICFELNDIGTSYITALTTKMTASNPDVTITSNESLHPHHRLIITDETHTIQDALILGGQHALSVITSIVTVTQQP